MFHLYNPFTPSEIAASADDFFGRSDELNSLQNSVTQGSVAIQGVVGIGKSSLLSRGLSQIQNSKLGGTYTSIVAVGDKDIKTVDDAARVFLESFLTVDESQKKITFKIGSLFESESTDVCKNFSEGRHLAALKRVVEEELIDKWLGKNKFLLLGMDEADKCPIPLARLVRSLCTHTQHRGIKRVRFVVAGVSPFFKQMVDEDPGVSRFFYRTIILNPMPETDAADLIETKLTQLAERAERDDIEIEINPEVVTKVVRLSGGHPHLLQLLGSHLVMHEADDPDGTIDSRDLIGSLRQICFEDRAGVYDSILHKLEIHGRRENLELLLRMAAPGFPTKIPRGEAVEEVTEESIEWFVTHQILTIDETSYGMVDEFLRIRFMLDGVDAEDRNAEKMIIRSVKNELASF
jgi:hypothetical protein